MIIDLIAGILISFGLAHFLDIPFTWWWIFLGAGFALLPDVDFLIEYWQRGTVGGKKLGSHRVLTHIPLLFVIGAVLVYVYVGTPLALLFILCVSWHFLHDIHAMGYGYRLFYPFSPKFYKLFSDREGKYEYNPRHLVTSWTRSEVETLHEKHGNDRWIQDHLRHHANKWRTSVILLLQITLVLLALLLLFRIIITL